MENQWTSERVRDVVFDLEKCRHQDSVSVRFEKQTDGTRRRRSAQSPDVESGFSKELKSELSIAHCCRSAWFFALSSLCLSGNRAAAQHSSTKYKGPKTYSLTVRIIQFAEVIPHRREPHGLSELLSMITKSSVEIPPECLTIRIYQPQPQHQPRERCNPSEYIQARRLRAVVSSPVHRVERALIVLRWLVDRSHDGLIAFDQSFRIHLRCEIESALSIVTRGFAKQPAFLFKSLPKLGAGQCIQQSHHREWNRTLADEVYLALEDVAAIIIKSNNEAGHDFHTIALNLLDRINHVAAVLSLLSFLETKFVWRLNSEEDSAEARALHISKQRIVFGEIYARLRQKRKGMAVSLLPGGKLGKKRSHVFLIADEIIINDEHSAFPSEVH